MSSNNNSWPPPKYEIPDEDKTPKDVLNEIIDMIQTTTKAVYISNLRRLVKILTENKTNVFSAQVKNTTFKASTPTISLFEQIVRVAWMYTEYNYMAYNANFMGFIWSGNWENNTKEFKPEHEPERQVRSRNDLLHNQYVLCYLGYLYYYAVPDDKKGEALERLIEKRDFMDITENDLISCVKVTPEKYNTIMAKKVFKEKVNVSLKNTTLKNNKYIKNHISKFMGGKRKTRKQKTRGRKKSF
jgi:hypothetical protein